jgi:SMC interacting uncharacterized protein involved in chromosome segregation
MPVKTRGMLRKEKEQGIKVQDVGQQVQETQVKEIQTQENIDKRRIILNENWRQLEQEQLQLKQLQQEQLEQQRLKREQLRQQRLEAEQLKRKRLQQLKLQREKIQRQQRLQEKAEEIAYRAWVAGHNALIARVYHEYNKNLVLDGN